MSRERQRAAHAVGAWRIAPVTSCAAVCALFLSGCASIPLAALVSEKPGLLPPVETQEPVPKKYEKKMNGEKDGEPRLKLTLPLAVDLCVTHNFRLLAGAEKVRQAEADLVTASLIPNSTLLGDYQLIPLQRANPQNQLGPTQADVLVSIPIDWLLFGKRAAARAAATLGISVAQWDFNDLQRLQISRTVDAFYEVLQTEEMLKHALENHDQLLKVEELTKALVKAGKVETLELNRVKLAILEAFLETHARELAVTAAKARLRPLIGKSASDPDFQTEGSLSVKVVVPPPKLANVVALADLNRPDLRSDLHDIDRRRADWELERRRAKPQVAIVPGWSYQNQRYITGFRNGSMFDIGLSTTLPITDRNQGNIRKAQSHYREAQSTYMGNRADALAEVETTLGEYEDAVEDITRNNAPATMKAALELKQSIDEGYKAGKRTLLDYLNAHQAYRLRLDRVIEFEANYWRKLNKLNTVVGVQAFRIDSADVIKVGENGK